MKKNQIVMAALVVLALGLLTVMLSMPGRVHAKGGTPCRIVNPAICGCSIVCAENVKADKAAVAAQAAAEKLQATYDAGCQEYIDNNGGHGLSVWNDESKTCKPTCSTGYHLNEVNACSLNLNTVAAPIISTQSISHGLTAQQIDAVIALLQAFGVDSSAITKIRELL